MTAFAHQAVLLAQTIALLDPQKGATYVDATVGGGGHAEAILECTAPDGRLIGLDRDAEARAAAGQRLARFGDRVVLVAAEFGELAEVVRSQGADHVAGVLADVGVSSPQLDHPNRGFSFREEGPLDMRMNPARGETARELIERLSEPELADVIYQFGEERRSRPIAASIKRAVAAGELNTTKDLAWAVHRVFPRRGRVDNATRTFQAIRIAVNDELGQLKQLTAQLPDVLVDGGVAAVISFHSLEDRIVKRAFRDDERMQVLTKKPVIAEPDEVERNPRARPAKLRGARRRARSEAGR